MKLKNTLRWMMGEDLITHLGKSITTDARGAIGKDDLRDSFPASWVSFFDLTLGNAARYFNGYMAVNLPPHISPPHSLTIPFEETHVDRTA